MDDIAHAMGRTRVDFRLDLLDGAGDNGTARGAKRLANVLRTAVGLSGYGAIPMLPEGEAMGVACVSSQDRATPTWTACVAHVAVDPTTGSMKVKKLTVATDVGTAVNPDGIRAQIEGAALWGVSLAMLEKATHEGRRRSSDQLRQVHADAHEPRRLRSTCRSSLTANRRAGVGEPTSRSSLPRSATRSSTPSARASARCRSRPTP